MPEAELSLWPLRAVFTSCWDTVLSEPVGVVLSSLPSLWEQENSWRSIFTWITPCQAMNCLISRAFPETDVQSPMSGGPSCLLAWVHPVVSALKGKEDILSRACIHEQAGKALKLERHCLKCCCSAMLFSKLGARCHFQTTSLTWIFCPMKRTLNITTVSGFSSTAWELLRRPGLACLASCWNAEPSCWFTFFLIFILTGPYFVSMGVFSGFYFQLWPGGPGGYDGCSALWALIFSLPWAGGWRNHSTESDCCCDGL